jgi:hypothetical protein
MKRVAILVLPFMAVLTVLGLSLLGTRFHLFPLRGQQAAPPATEEEAPE